MNCEDARRIIFSYYRETPRNNRQEIEEIEDAYRHIFSKPENKAGVNCAECNHYLERIKKKELAV